MQDLTLFTLFTPEHMKKVTEILMSEITPMMLHQLGLNRKRV